MKTFNKIFAIAAIAAASLFSAQNASAAVISENGTETEYAYGFDVTFEMLKGSDWAAFDQMIEENPNRQQIVVLGVQLNDAKHAGTLTSEEEQEYLEALLALDCPAVLALMLLVV